MTEAETTTMETWPERVSRRYPPVAAAVMLLVAGIGAIVGPVRLDIQLLVLGFAIVLFGPPQVANDPKIGRALLEPRYGGVWQVPFLALLLGIAGLVLAGWLLVPTLTLLVVLTVTAIQVGREAAEAHGRNRDPLIVSAFAGLPSVLPAAFDPADVGTFLAWVTRTPDPATWIGPVAGFAPPAAIAWFTLAGLAAGRLLRRPRALAPISELVAGAILFAFAPPLIALACYLSAAQGLRGLLGIGTELAPDDGRSALALSFRRGAPLVGAALALVAFGLVVALYSGLAPGQALALVPIWAFGALALPHLALKALDPLEGPRSDDFFGPESRLARIRHALRLGRRRVAQGRPQR